MPSGWYNKTASSQNSITGEQTHHSTGTHYNPWQKAKLTDGREVWIIRQFGNGEDVAYQAFPNEILSEEKIQQWL